MRHLGNAGMRFSRAFLRQNSSSSGKQDEPDQLGQILGLATGTFMGCLGTFYYMTETHKSTVALQTGVLALHGDVERILQNQARNQTQIMEALIQTEGSRCVFKKPETESHPHNAR